jgi:hypothetical protein
MLTYAHVCSRLQGGLKDEAGGHTVVTHAGTNANAASEERKLGVASEGGVVGNGRGGGGEGGELNGEGGGGGGGGAHPKKKTPKTATQN